MRPLAPEEVVPLERYEAQRAHFRDTVIAHKRRRRLPVGEKVSLLFEDRETLRFQVQEMLCVERISDPARVRYELDVYNELMPGERELSATLFVEITDAPSIRPELDRLVGIDEHVFLELGSGADSERVHAHFDAKQFEDDRISAVQYIRFALSEEQARRFQDLREPARLHVDHPNYDRRAELRGGLRESLAHGLTADPAALLEVSDETPAPRPPLVETARVHALAAGPAGEVVVEPKQDAGSFLEVEDALLGELLDVVREVARRMVEERGSCRITSAAGHGAGGVRFLLSPA